MNLFIFRSLIFRVLLPSLLLLSQSAFCFDVPKLTGPVVDEMSFYSSEEFQNLSALLNQFAEKSEMQMAVLIPKSLQGLPIEDYSIKVTDVWKLGRKKNDLGLLFIVAPIEKKMRLEVGYGLEGDIPDVIAKRLVSDIVRPYFKQQKFYQGTKALIFQIAQIKNVKLEGAQALPLRNSEKSMPLSSSSFYLVIFIIFGLLSLRSRFFPSLLLLGLGGRGGGSGWGSGGGGGGGFSGGGGGFGGGGASSDW